VLFDVMLLGMDGFVVFGVICVMDFGLLVIMVIVCGEVIDCV